MKESTPSRRRWIVAAVLAVAAIALALLWGRQAAGFLEQNLDRLTSWVEDQGIWGPVVFALAYVLATLLFIPGSLLTAAAGFVFGLVKGTALVLVAATVGACLAFLLGRHGARHAVERRLEKSDRFQAIDRAIAKEGRKVVMLLRLSPVFPFTLLNYGLGLTGVRFRDYLVACAAMAPGTFLYVYYGYTAKNLADLAGGGGERGAAQWIFLGVGLAATVAVTAVVTRIARHALKEAADV
ncbi:MAG: TVP38/TMEM64 family protein [Acidobacteria bacterium]|nr:TVP38/TMEM64 family protein [Acidobacteriota bacterium]